MRFLQCSDVHLNMTPDIDLPWGKDRANAIKASFRAVVEKAGEISADCLFICGNLFHRSPLTTELNELNKLFMGIPNTRVIIISGSEDRANDSSALLSFQWADNVYWMLKQEESLYFEDINAEIRGITCPVSELGMLSHEEGTPSPLLDPIRILLFHDSTRSSFDIEAPELDELPYDYIAVGGSHKPQHIRKRQLVCSGSPEPLGIEDTGEHGVYMGDISAITHNLQRLEFLKISDTRYINLSYMLDLKSSASGLKPLIVEAIEAEGIDNIYTIRLSGKSNRELAGELARELKEYRIADIIEETETDYDYQLLYREHPTDLIGYYIRSFLKPDEDASELSTTERLALDYGLRAMLSDSKEDMHDN